MLACWHSAIFFSASWYLTNYFNAVITTFSNADTEMKEAATDTSGKKSKKKKSKSEIAVDGEPMSVDKVAATNGDASEEPKSEKTKKKKDKRKLDEEPAEDLNGVSGVDASEDGTAKKKKKKKAEDNEEDVQAKSEKKKKKKSKSEDGDE